MVLLRCLITISRFWLLGTAAVHIGSSTVSIHDLTPVALPQVGAATVSPLHLTPMVFNAIWIRYGVFNVIHIGLYQQFGPSTVSSIPSPMQLTFGAAAVLSILSPIRLYHECGAATMSSTLSHTPIQLSHSSWDEYASSLLSISIVMGTST